MVIDHRDAEISLRDSASVGRDVASITRAKLARRQQMGIRRPYFAGNASGGAESSISNVKPNHNVPRNNGGDESPEYSPEQYSSWAEIPSLLSNASNDTYDTMDQNTMETALFKKFEEAFDMTLRNNPGILPGAPMIIESIKMAMFKVQKSKAIREVEMRNQLDRLKGEMTSMEQQLSQQMGSIAMKKSELTKVGNETFAHESLKKQLEAMEAVKDDLKHKMDGANVEKKEMVKHLDLLSKSRVELEKKLDKEVKIVEKSKEALQAIIKERKKLEKQRDENKELEDKVEKMTEVASKEKKALQDEVAEHKKFMEHIQTLKDQNELTKQELEKEKKEILGITQTLQAKKSALLESKADLERQFQKEINELESQLADAKIAHENHKESLVKSRVMSFLRHGGDNNENKGQNAEIEAMISAGVESEMKARKKAKKKARNLADDSSDDESSIDSFEERRGKRRESKGGDMKQELEMLRRELDLVRATTPRSSGIDVPRSPYLSEPGYYASATPRSSSQRTPRFFANRGRFDSFDAIEEDRNSFTLRSPRTPRTPYSRASPTASRTPRSHYF